MKREKRKIFFCKNREIRASGSRAVIGLRMGFLCGVIYLSAVITAIFFFLNRKIFHIILPNAFQQVSFDELCPLFLYI